MQFPRQPADAALAVAGCHLPTGSVSAATKEIHGPELLLNAPDFELTSLAWQQRRFNMRHGHFLQLVKNETVHAQLRQGFPVVESTRSLLAGIQSSGRNLLLFTNNVENPDFFKALAADFTVAPALEHVHEHGFTVFSAGTAGSSHSMHAHGQSWLLQVHGRKAWWFLPPRHKRKAAQIKRTNACGYLRVGAPAGAQLCVQQPGEIIRFPTGWQHATCMLDAWSVSVGAQAGPPSTSYTVPRRTDPTPARGGDRRGSSMHRNSSANRRYGVNVSAYYDSLEGDIQGRRQPQKVGSLAVHRWLGRQHSTTVHYELIHSVIAETQARHRTPSLRVMDAGCGVGGALTWMEKREPGWQLSGRTISAEQLRYIREMLPAHRFGVELLSYDDPLPDRSLDAIYSIEAAIHSPDLAATLRRWAAALAPGGVVVLIDDFWTNDAKREDYAEAELVFRRAWLANSPVSSLELREMAGAVGLFLASNRDLGEEYDVVGLNYQNTAPALSSEKRSHQGWLGALARRILTVGGVLQYRMIALRKPAPQDKGDAAGRKLEARRQQHSEGAARDGGRGTEVLSQHMSGHGQGGGQKVQCISPWYCCGKGLQLWDSMQARRTGRKVGYLQLGREVFGDYMQVFASALTGHYEALAARRGKGGGTTGRFLDIGGTGSTQSGMKQVTSKFAHFAGPLEYWKLDVDKAARGLPRTLVCDIEDCAQANSSSFEVTFSHTVLEHTPQPWRAFDTISRLTARGGLTLHIVPWSYQYHATPGDYFRFSHTALASLLSRRGFEVLSSGLDVCTRPQAMKEKVDEHFDTIWLSYVVGRKL